MIPRQFTTVSEPDILKTFSKSNESLKNETNHNNETKSFQSSHFGIDDLLKEYTKPTEKDNIKEPAQAAGTGSQPGTTQTGAAQPVTDTRKKVIRMFWKVIDIIASIILSLPKTFLTGEMAEREDYKSSDQDLKDLTEAMYEYEIATGKKVATSPLTNLWMTIGAVYTDRLYMVTKDVIQGIKERKKRSNEAGSHVFQPSFVQPDSEHEKTENRGGARTGSGRHKNWCASLKGKNKKCDCRNV